jgi:uncharacterized protein (DUF1501 family)
LAIPAPKSGNDQTCIDLDGFFGLHPSLRPFKDLWDAQALAIIHAAGSPDPSHSHFEAMDYMERGTPGQRNISTGWVARHLQAFDSQNTSPLRAVGVSNTLPAALHGPLPVTTFETVSKFQLQIPSAQAAAIRARIEALYDLNSGLAPVSKTIFEAMDLLSKLVNTSYAPTGSAKYPPSAFGAKLEQVAQIAKAGLGLEVAYLDIGGWDTHSNQGGVEGELPNLLNKLSASLSAFYTDMGDLAKKLTIVTMSEFGRRARQNGSNGTDHGHGNCMFVIGGGIKGGKVYGKWPSLSADKLYGPGDLDVTTDYREVLAEILTKRVKNSNLAQIFPDFSVSEPLGFTQG